MRFASSALAFLILGLNAFAAEPSRESPAPSIAHIGLVQPDLLAVVVEEGQVVFGDIVHYVAQAGDIVENNAIDSTGDRRVKREGVNIGYLVGREGSLLRKPDTFVGPRLDRDALQATAHWSLSIAQGVPVPEILAIYRKSTPNIGARLASGDMDFEFRHTLFMQLSAPLPTGALCTLESSLPFASTTTFTNSPRSQRSLSVHATHVGFRPSDPLKIAYISLWTGDGPAEGSLRFEPGTPFHLIEEETGATAFSGHIHLRKHPTTSEDRRDWFWTNEQGERFNYSKTFVYEADFSTFSQPGRYRVYLDGVGCSDPFIIRRDAWEEPFRATLAGLLNHRSGVELGPPFTDYQRPIGFRPGVDSFKVFASSLSLMDSKMGIGNLDFEDLVAGKTDTMVEAWGGYMDAGDWDRRIQHLVISFLLMDLVELFPAFLGELELSVPENANHLPDLIDEALFNLQVYRQMQRADGAVRGGIESAEHPRGGETSWHESLEVFAYDFDPWSTYQYAMAAAKAAKALAPYDAELASEYQDSAESAWSWAEQTANPPNFPAGKEEQFAEQRAFAAAVLFSLTGNAAYHDAFKASMGLNASSDNQEIRGIKLLAAWTYLNTRGDQVDSEYQSALLHSFLWTVDTFYVESVDQMGYGTAKHPWVKIGWGAGTHPDRNALSILHAYLLTHDKKYLRKTLRMLQFGLGANPFDMSLITGVGHRWPEAVLHVDSLNAKLPLPKGIAVFGVLPSDHSVVWPLDWHLIGEDALYPSFEKWPTMENFHGHQLWAPMTEYTVTKPISSTLYCYGILTALATEEPVTEPDVAVDMRAARLRLDFPSEDSYFYQLESSSNLRNWRRASSIISGSGAMEYFFHPLPQEEGLFFRISIH